MDHSVLFSSPNWFRPSVLVVSSDNWIMYGGPSKSLCILEPLPPDEQDTAQKYNSHFTRCAHGERIVSLDISPEWPAKRAVITGAADGSVKQWNLEHVNNKLIVKTIHSHEIHLNEKEEVAGVGYSTETHAVTVGCSGNVVKWHITSNVVKNYNMIKSFRPTCFKCSPHLPLHVAVGTKQGIILLLDLNGTGKILYKVRGHDEEIYNLGWCPQYEVEINKILKQSANSRMESIRASAQSKSSVDESIDSSVNDSQADITVASEDDMFDIYKDHEPDEFGHKKYQPEDILVKVKSEDTEATDYLTDCLKLKSDILKMKNEAGPSIESLVEAMDKTQLEHGGEEKETEGEKSGEKETGGGKSGEKKEMEREKSEEMTPDSTTPASVHIHRHLLASIGRHGSVRIWSKTGKLVANGNTSGSGKQKGKSVTCVALLWYKADQLLVADGNSALYQCNPFKVNQQNKLDWKPIHNLHIRGLYCIASGAPSKQPIGEKANWPVWTVAQDRKLIQYSLEEKKPIAIHATCGGFVYGVAPCPYDASKIAVSVGDGAVRVWHAAAHAAAGAGGGDVLTYWQNVLGKVLTVAWHPTHENILAFGTAEARVGTIDTSGRVERAARALPPALGNGVYSLTWTATNQLYACGGSKLFSYRPSKPHQAAEALPVVVEGREWRVSEASWAERGLCVGSAEGAVAVLAPTLPHDVLAAAYPFTKIIHSIEWHPQQVSTSSEESVHRNRIAVCSMEKNIVILEFIQEEGKASLSVVQTLVGHRRDVTRVCWSPHHEAMLLSTSMDTTVRVWDCAEGVCTGLYVGHSEATLCGCWSPVPSLADCVLTGGSDCCLRFWDTRLYPYSEQAESELELLTDKKKKNKKAKEEVKEAKQEKEIETVANTEVRKLKTSKKFLLPIMNKQLHSGNINACRKLFDMHLARIRDQVTNGHSSEEKEIANGEEKAEADKADNFDCDYIKIFGSTNDVNELLDMEQARHSANAEHEAWVLLALLRGDVAGAVTYAAQRDSLGPFLLSLSPCVSYKYWKDTMQLYLAQMERLVARGEEEQLQDTSRWGGAAFRRVVSLLAVHEVEAAADTLHANSLHKEAYVLCRARHAASLAENALRRWADQERNAPRHVAAAACYVALGDISQAAAVLGRSCQEDHLHLAADMARFLGQDTYAAHVTHKVNRIRSERESNAEQLDPLPTRVDLLAAAIQDTLTVASTDIDSEHVRREDVE